MLLFKSDRGVLCSNSLQHKCLWITVNQRQRPHDSQPDAQEPVRCRSGFCHTTGSTGMNGTIYHSLPTLPQLLRKAGYPQCDPRPEPDDGAGLPHRQRGQALQQLRVAPQPRHLGMAGAGAHV